MEPFPWWKSGIIYQIYPRSFMDGDGDGVGDLKGVMERLDYVAWLGVDAIWLSPIYPSPMADFGYDVSDYTGIHPLFGTMTDFDALLAATHARSLKLLLDFVPNHSSDRHPWFLESRASRESPKRDWYLWEDPAPDGGPPNNWLSVFGGPAWTFDEATGQYYYHAFLKEQPDLNWRNPDVQAAMFDAMRFWLDKGVDGFRIDVLWHLIKDKNLRNNPPNPHYRPEEMPYNRLLPVYSTDQPEVHDIVGMMRRVTDAYEERERVLIGEIYLPIERLVVYYGEDGLGAHLPFNFQLITLPWDARTIDAVIGEYEGALPPHGWPNWVLGNHDQGRIASRIGNAQARVAAMLLLTLRGTPTMYYGDEIGMQNGFVPPSRMQDPQAKNLGPRHSRDPARTPMQWDASEYAGFSRDRPWLPVDDSYRDTNVEAQRGDPTSLLTLYRTLIEHRRSLPALSIGSYAPVETQGALLAYVRCHDTQRVLVALNLGAEAELLPVPNESGRILLSTYLNRAGELIDGQIRLRPDEGVTIMLD